MKIQFFNCSVTGPSHIREGLPNQDSLLSRSWGQRWAVVVCDGMGSRQRSDIGSREAAKAAILSVKTLSFDADYKLIVQTLYQSWLKRLKLLHIRPSDAVTTCILVWGMSDGRFRYVHLGDGVITSPVATISTERNSGFSNETTGLGLSKNFSDWRFGSGCLQEQSDSLILMSDGISDDLTDPQAFTRELRNKLHRKTYRQAKKWLRKQLKAWPTPGHSDDKSLVLLCKK